MINIKTINSSDSYESMVSIINTNFNQLAVAGGGPQGPFGPSGFPGLPGRDGRIGLQGEPGQTGTRFTVYYSTQANPALVPPGLSANQAILAGHLEGDTWLDQSINRYYTLVFTPTPTWDVKDVSFSVFEQIFKKSTLSSGSYPYEQSLLNNLFFNHGGSPSEPPSTDEDLFNISLLISSVGFADPDTAAEDVYSRPNFLNPIFGTWNRKSFKVTLDQVRQENLATQTGIATNIYAGALSGEEFTPILYLGERFDATTAAAGFGILSYSQTGNANQILSLMNDEDSSGEIYLASKKIWGDGDVLLNSGTDDINRFGVIMPSKSAETTSWYGMLSFEDPNSVDVFDSYNPSTGMSVIKSATTNEGEIKFYTSSDVFGTGDSQSKEVASLDSAGTFTVKVGDFVLEKNKGIGKVLAESDGSGTGIWTDAAEIGAPYYSINFYPTSRTGTDTDTLPTNWYFCDGSNYLLAYQTGIEPWYSHSEYQKDVYFIVPNLEAFDNWGICLRPIIKLPPNLVKQNPVGDHYFVGLGGSLAIDHTVTPTPQDSTVVTYTDCNGGAGGGGNLPPTARFEVTPLSGTSVTDFLFDATSSTDPVGSPGDLQMRWKFKDSESWTAFEALGTKNYTYGSPEGTFNVSLEIKNQYSLSDLAYDTVEVADDGALAPTADFEINPKTGDTTTTFTFTSTSIDNNAGSPGDTSNLEYFWDYDDGNDTGWGSPDEVTHSYSTGDTNYSPNLTVRLIGSPGITDYKEYNLYVANPPSTFEWDLVSGGSSTIADGDAVRFTPGTNVNFRVNIQERKIYVDISTSGGGGVTLIGDPSLPSYSGYRWYAAIGAYTTVTDTNSTFTFVSGQNCTLTHNKTSNTITFAHTPGTSGVSSSGTGSINFGWNVNVETQTEGLPTTPDSIEDTQSLNLLGTGNFGIVFDAGNNELTFNVTI